MRSQKRKAPDALRGETADGTASRHQAHHRPPAHETSCPVSLGREHPARQGNNKFGEFIDLAIDSDRSPMLLRNDVVGDRQAEAGALAGWLGGEEWLEQLVPD